MSCDQQRLADYLAHIAQAIERIGVHEHTIGSGRRYPQL